MERKKRRQRSRGVGRGGQQGREIQREKRQREVGRCREKEMHTQRDPGSPP